jgi:ubiquinone/menaquinone biosynthesis C-methylase UbiE
MTRAERRAAQQAARAAALAERLASLLDLHGDERVVDVGCGTGAAVYALAPTAREVIGVDSDASMIEVARREAPANAGFELADGEQLPFATGDFDVGTTLRTLHHTRNPDRLLAELVRVTKPGGTILVVDPTTSHVLTEAELRGLLARLGLILGHAEVVTEPRDLEAYLDLAGCAGAARERAIRLAPPGYEAAIGWFVLLRP